MGSRTRRRPPAAPLEPIPSPGNLGPYARRLPWLIALAGVVVYLNSFSGVFVLDDVQHITQNTKIESLEPISKFLRDQRPVVTLSLAINYALGERQPWGYHLFNVAVHLAAGLTLFGVVHRTLGRHASTAIRPSAVPWLAGTVALIWVVHPLQTQCVTYIIQRAESMMGLFYLLTLYCLIRSLDARLAPGWWLAAIGACAAGMASKAVMLTAPVMTLAYDRLFVSASFREAFRRRWPLYVGLACTWYILWATGVAPGVLNTQPKIDATVGFSHTGCTPLEYALTQPGVILHYLRLAIWPHPLCLDYRWPIARDVVSIVVPGLVLVLLLGGVVWALRRRSWLGFGGLWFFLILSPTSSFIPIKDAAFEHRMYLPSAAVVTLLVVGGYRLCCGRRLPIGAPNRIRAGVMAAVVVLLVLLLGSGTIRRNRAYDSLVTMYQDVVRTRPNNARAYTNLGSALRFEHRDEEALQAYQGALRADPTFASAHHNIAAILEDRGQQELALEHFRQALELEPSRAWRHFNLANCLAKLKRYDDAIAEYKVALELEPNDYECHQRLASVLMTVNRPEQAIDEYRRAIESDPTKAQARYHLGLTLQRLGRLEEAADAFRGVLEVAPGLADARSDLGVALTGLGRVEEAVSEYREVLRRRPDHVAAQYNLGFALQKLGRFAEAADEYRRTLQLQPNHADAHSNLGSVLQQLGRAEEAIQAFQQAIALDPRHATARYNLGITLYNLDRLDEAIAQFQALLTDNPGHEPARRALDSARRRQAAQAVQP